MAAETSMSDRPRTVPEVGAGVGRPGVVPDDVDPARRARAAAGEPGVRRPVDPIVELAPEDPQTETEPAERPRPEVITEVAPETAPTETEPAQRPRPEVITEVAPETAPTETDPAQRPRH